MEKVCLEEEIQEIERETLESALPYFIVIKRSKDKKVRIPCVNKKIADKVATAYSALSKKP